MASAWCLVMRQAKQDERLHFYLTMLFKRLKKPRLSWLVQTRVGCVVPLASVRECRCDGSLLLVLRAMAWKRTAVHKHSSIVGFVFFPRQLTARDRHVFSLWISQQKKAVVTAEETMKNSIGQFQQSSARKKNIQ